MSDGETLRSSAPPLAHRREDGQRRRSRSSRADAGSRFPATLKIKSLAMLALCAIDEDADDLFRLAGR